MEIAINTLKTTIHMHGPSIFWLQKLYILFRALFLQLLSIYVVEAHNKVLMKYVSYT